MGKFVLLRQQYLRPSSPTNLTAQRLDAAFRGVFGFFIGTVIFYVLALIFGAPMITYVRLIPPKRIFSHAPSDWSSDIQSTMLWSALMSSLAVVPASCTIGADPDEWRRLFLMAMSVWLSALLQDSYFSCFCIFPFLSLLQVG